MNRNLLLWPGRILFVVALWLGISATSFGQSSFTYTLGGLTVEIEIQHVCTGTVTNSGGSLKFHVVSTEGGVDAQLAIVGPPNLFPGATIPQGGTYEFNASHLLPTQTYNWLLGDGTNTIGSLAPVPVPALTVQSLPLLSVSKDVESNNTSCFTENGQIVASIVGGSQALGPTTYSYTWSANNGMATFSGTVPSGTPLNLATLLGRTGLGGGIYNLDITDENSYCTARATFTITDPSPADYPITTGSPLSICAGDPITITLSNSEAGVTYEILRNLASLPTPITFIGTGVGPFEMTFPSAGFSSGSKIMVKATNGACTPI